MPTTPIIKVLASAADTFKLQSRQLGFKVEFADSNDEDQEDWEDVLDEMEDVWMREPAGVHAVCCSTALAGCSMNKSELSSWHT
jgi:hypothetical protein